MAGPKIPKTPNSGYGRILITDRLVARVGGRSPVASADDLIRELEQLVAERPDFAPAYAYLARLYAAESRAEEAARAAERRDVLARAAAHRR